MTDTRPPVPVPEGDGTDHPLANRDPKTFPDQPVARNGRGLEMPKVGLGTWRLDDQALADLVPRALEIGYRHVDTAQMYGNEKGLGRGLATAGIDRDEVFITTKIDNDNHEPDELVRSLDESLDRLGTDHVDLLLIHWPVEWSIMGATLAALTQVQAAGRAHHIGVSNFTVDQLDQVGGFAPIEVLQVECHPFLQQRELRRWCRDHDVVVTAYSPLAKGAVLDDQTLTDIGAAHDTTGAGAALGWLSSLDGMVSIPRTSDRDHLADNWTAGSLELSTDEIARIEDLDEGRRLIDPDFAPW